MWHTPSNLSRYADRARVPIRECLADVLAENRSDLPDVDFDDYEAVYDALLQSEKIVRGRTSFAVEVDDATTLRYSTARPDAPEVASTSGGARGDRGKPFGNPLFRAEGDLFENVAPGGGGGGWPPPRGCGRGAREPVVVLDRDRRRERVSRRSANDALEALETAAAGRRGGGSR